MKATLGHCRDRRPSLLHSLVLLLGLLASIASITSIAVADDHVEDEIVTDEDDDVDDDPEQPLGSENIDLGHGGQAQDQGQASISDGSWLSMILNSGLVVPHNITDQCRRDIIHFVESLFTTKHGSPGAKWTLRAIDSYGKLPTGVMEGDFSWMGRYHECTDIEVHRNEQLSQGQPDFTGKYCLTFVVIVDDKGNPIQTPIYPKFGTCFPSTCTEVDIAKVMNMYTPITPIRFAVPERFCQVKNQHGWQFRNIFAIFVISVLVALVLFGTIQDSNSQWQAELLQGRRLAAGADEPPNTIFRKLERFSVAFSIPKNMASIFSVATDSSPMDCLHGFRFLTTVWVIVVHIFVMGVQDYPWKNILEVTQIVRNNFWAQAITGATLASDSFFFMSGLLVCYHGLNQLKQHNGQFHLGIFYLHRYFRLVPAYALTVLFIGGLLIKVGQGPLWPMLYDSTDKCAAYWWKNMLFIQNLWGSFYDQCFLPSWYLAVDFQMYLASPLFLLPLYRNPPKGVGYVCLGLAVTIIMPGVLIYIYDMESYTGMQSRAANMDLWTNMVYEKPWNRMSSYFIGMLLGYLFHTRGFQIRMSRFAVYLGWTLCICTSLAIIFGPFEHFKGELMTRKMYALYGAFARPTWAACMAWIIFACITGNGGIVNGVLGWKMFAPFGRLSYCIYLTHLMVVHFVMYSVADGNYIQFTHIIVLMVGLISISIFTALVLSLLVEAPMLQIEKMILKRYLSPGEGSDTEGKSGKDQEDVWKTNKFSRHKQVVSRYESPSNGSLSSSTGSATGTGTAMGTARRRL